MACNCNEDRLILNVKQGEDKSFSIAIKDKQSNPVDLTGYTVEVNIKKYPLFKVDSLITKVFGVTPVDGSYIADAEDGEIILKILAEETIKLNPDFYYLIITLINGNGNRTIISGEGDKSGVLKICNQ